VFVCLLTDLTGWFNRLSYDKPWLHGYPQNTQGSGRELPQEEVRPQQPAPPQEEAEATRPWIWWISSKKHEETSQGKSDATRSLMIIA
jgi:hypothetical protein